MIEYREFIDKNPNWHNKWLGNGTTANCFKMNNDEVFKLFDNPIDYEDPLFKNIMGFEGLKFEHILFPKELVVDKVSAPSFIYGYTTPYIRSKIELNTKLQLILEKIKLLEKEVISLSKEHSILMNDLWLQNVIMSRDALYYIDTDYYEKYEEYNIEIEKDNNMDSNSVIFQTLTGIPLYIFNYSYLPKKLGEMYREISVGNEGIILFLEEYIKYLEKVIQREIKTLKDLKVSSEYVLRRNKKIQRVLHT